MATLEATETLPAEREGRLALGAALVTVILWSSGFVGIRSAGRVFSAEALALGRLLIASVALGVVLLVRRESLPSVRALPGDRGLRRLLVRLLQRRPERGGTPRRRGDGGDARQRRAAPHCGSGRRDPARGLSARAARRLSRRADGRGRDRRGDVEARSRSELGRRALPRRRAVLRRRRRRAETAARTGDGAAGDVGSMRGRRARLPPVRAEARPRAAARVSVRDRLDVLPRGLPDGDRVPDVGVRALANDRGKMGSTTYLVTPIAVLLGWMLLGETPPALAFAGGALCLVGVAIARRAR